MENKIKELIGVYQYRLGLTEGVLMTTLGEKEKLVINLQINIYKQAIKDLKQLL